MFKFGFSKPKPTQDESKAEQETSPTFRKPKDHVYPDMSLRDLRESMESAALLAKNGIELEKIKQRGQGTVSVVEEGVYEGGYKVWSCAYDLVEYLHKEQCCCQSRILELGCGQSLPALYALRYHYPRTVTLQEYNEDVLEKVTYPNVVGNCETVEVVEGRCLVGTGAYSACKKPKQQQSCDVRLVSGDWRHSDMAGTLGEGAYDLVFTTDSIYNPKYIASLLQLMVTCLSPGGMAYIGAKRYYFGNGGSVKLLLEAVKRTAGLDVSSRHTINDKKSEVRELIVLQKAKQKD